MAWKTLIINGSPRRDGNNAALIRELEQHLADGSVIQNTKAPVFAYRSLCF